MNLRIKVAMATFIVLSSMLIFLFGTALTQPAAGISWKTLNNTATAGGLGFLGISDTEIFAYYENGFFVSTHSGEDMVRAGRRIGHVNALVTFGADLFAGTDIGVFLSTDQGKDWTEADNGLGHPEVLSLVLSGTSLFAVTNNHWLVRSTDHGASWSRLENPPGNCEAVIANGGDLFTTSHFPIGTFLSTNIGRSWNALGLAQEVKTLAFNGTCIYAGTNEHGVYLSTNIGRSWTAVNEGLAPPVTVNSFVMIGTSIVAGTTSGVFLSTDKGKLWTALNNGLPDTHVKFLVVRGTQLFAGTFTDIFRADAGSLFPAPIGDLPEALHHDLSELQVNPDDLKLREEIIVYVQGTKAKPKIPDEAERYLVRGQAAFKEAQDAVGYNAAIAEFDKAALIAPWVGNIYYNLGLAQKMAGKYEAAILSLKLYLLASPTASDSQAVKDSIYAIEYRSERKATVDAATIDLVSAIHRPNIETGCTPMLDAIKRGANINAREENGWTALSMSLVMGDEKAALWLIDHGADVNVADKQGKTPLMTASGYHPNRSNINIVRTLIIKGADVNAKDIAGRTALWWAEHSVPDWDSANSRIYDEREMHEIISLLQAAARGSDSFGRFRIGLAKQCRLIKTKEDSK